YHGPLSVTVQATTRDVNGTTAAGSSTINVSVAARADLPNATAANVTGAEDGSIALTGLSAALVDTDGSEVLSVKISGVPDGTIFSAGGNNGDGSWTIPVSALASLQLTPPQNYSGVLNLTLNAYSLELSNGNTSVRSVPFTVTITQAADTVALDAAAVTVNEDATVVLPLQLRMEDKSGTGAGENAAETVELTFAGLPGGTILTSAGATLVNLGGGSWRFTGTEAQANAISLAAPENYSGTSTVTVTAVAIDAGQRGAATVDTFSLAVSPVVDAPMLQTNPMIGATGVALPVNLFANLSDTDGSETLSVSVSNVPTGALFSAGSNLGAGVWSFTPAQLPGLTLTLQAGTVNTTMNVSVTATETATGATAAVNGTIAVTVGSGPLTLLGTTGVDVLTGSGSDDTITGSSGDDTLSGGGGNDSLVGGTGNDSMLGGVGDDTFVVDSAADIVVENASAGTDTVKTSVNLTLANNVENLVYTGAASFTGTGNTLANSITGGALADTLDGGEADDTLSGGDGNDSLVGGIGNDSMTGGLGDDTFDVDSAADTVVEAASGGTDTIRTSVNLTLANNVENLTYTGAASFTGTGNTLANRITGGALADTISGGGGADTLVGGAGADSLSGGSGADVFRYLAGHGSSTDQITDFSATAGGDVLDIEALLPGYNGNPLSLSSYVNLQASGGNTNVRIDATGSGSFSGTLVIFNGVTGLDLDTLRSQANLVA
ncbi:MAG: calcium-binding protein, partial [Beijerinckiaceae bacterium]